MLAHSIRSVSAIIALISLPQKTLYPMECKAMQFKLACHHHTLLFIPICVALQGTGSWKWSKPEIIWGGNDRKSKKHKDQRVLFNQITSLHNTMQRALHSVRMRTLPKQSVTFKVRSPHTTDTSVLQLLAEWLHCPHSTRARTVAQWLGLLKPTGTKYPEVSRGADRHS